MYEEKFFYLKKANSLVLKERFVITHFFSSYLCILGLMASGFMYWLDRKFGGYGISWKFYIDHQGTSIHSLEGYFYGFTLGAFFFVLFNRVKTSDRNFESYGDDILEKLIAIASVPISGFILAGILIIPFVIFHSIFGFGLAWMDGKHFFTALAIGPFCWAYVVPFMDTYRSVKDQAIHGISNTEIARNFMERDENGLLTTGAESKFGSIFSIDRRDYKKVLKDSRSRGYDEIYDLVLPEKIDGLLDYELLKTVSARPISMPSQDCLIVEVTPWRQTSGLMRISTTSFDRYFIYYPTE